MTQTYLLQVEERYGETPVHTDHVIDAGSEQMVKYHFHRTLKDWGYADTQFGKHVLESWDVGATAEIYNIIPLDPVEERVMKQYLHSWPKI